MITALILIILFILINSYFWIKSKKKYNIFINIVLLLQLSWVYFCFVKYDGFSIDDNKEKYPELFTLNCGVVIERIDGFERHGKHHNEYFEEYLVIHYDNGFYERKNVSRNTYENHKVGSKICFYESTNLHDWFVIILIFGGFICFILSIISVGVTFGW